MPKAKIIRVVDLKQFTPRNVGLPDELGAELLAQLPELRAVPAGRLWPPLAGWTTTPARLTVGVVLEPAPVIALNICQIKCELPGAH